jgi:hypothetical protein
MRLANKDWSAIIDAILTNKYTESHLGLSHLNLSKHHLHQLNAVLNFNHYIRSLDLENNNFEWGIGYLLASNTTLTHLNLRYNKLCFSDKVWMSNTTLTSLDLSNTQYPFFALDMCTWTPALQYLNLSKTKITDGRIASCLGKLKLLHLDISSTNIGAQTLEALTMNSTLTSINVSNTGIVDHSATIFSIHVSITELDIAQNNIGDQCAIDLADNTKLIRLNLSSNVLSDKSVVYLAENNNTLKNLDISHNNNVGQEGLRSLALNRTLNSLNVSHIKSRAWTNKFLIKLFSESNTLTALNISGNLIGNESALFLAKNTYLKFLKLSEYVEASGCLLRDEVAFAFQYNKSLLALEIAGNKFSIEGLQALANNGSLRYLNVKGKVCFEKSVALQVFLLNKTLKTLKINLIDDKQKVINHHANPIKRARNSMFNPLVLMDNVFQSFMGVMFPLALNEDTFIMPEVTLPLTASINSVNNSLTHLDICGNLKWDEKTTGELMRMYPNVDRLNLESESAAPYQILVPYQKRLEAINAFLMGTHHRVGFYSPVRKFRKSVLFEKDVMPLIFSFLGHHAVEKIRPVKRVLPKIESLKQMIIHRETKERIEKMLAEVNQALKTYNFNESDKEIILQAIDAITEMALSSFDDPIFQKNIAVKLRETLLRASDVVLDIQNIKEPESKKIKVDSLA